MSETANRGRPLVDMSTRPYQPVPTTVLSNRVENWVEESADSGRVSAPTSEITAHGTMSDMPEGGHFSDNEGVNIYVSEDSEDTSTVRGHSEGTSDLDAYYDTVADSVDTATPQVSNLSCNALNLVHFMGQCN